LSSLVSKSGAFIGVRSGEGFVDLNAAIPSLGWRDVGMLLLKGELDIARFADIVGSARHTIDPQDVRYRPILAPGAKVLCLGLNYVDHATESQNPKPSFPVVFGRYESSLVAHNEPLVLPHVSEHLDFEAELAVVIGKRGRYISPETALDHVAGYTLFNDGSIRDYQLKSSQWMLGKNFDSTGSIGPELVTADELPPGAEGLRLEGKLNGVVMQTASTTDMIFSVATTISLLSEAMTLECGDVIASGTPAGVGFARTPPVFMKPGDVFEVSVERVGTLRNRIVDERGRG
jgi:2-keto-4-pentenoate hydratase/2-oxohepta-3-ene-1,7-dioic acid hydratase in catechol pathway